ncbi:RHS repeat-associated core domain-containing protein [Dactylosporangium sp. NPDC050688]|uniref:RHS repeat-associated core domain-containing protein n=1 Tax=Dactylosporangium sp. NPDC050688 TaxID=3157217 RepID=UPI00340D8CC3
MSGLRGRVRAMALAAALFVIAGLQVVGAASAAPVKPETLSGQRVTPIHGMRVTPQARPKDLTQGAGTAKPGSVVWPSGTGEASVPVSASSLDAQTSKTATRTRAGALPVWVGAPAAKSGGKAGRASRVRVSVRDRAAVPAALRDGVVFDVARADGESAAGDAAITVDYGGFATAYGGDWASRLRLVELPACALTTPGEAACRAVPVASHNDLAQQQVTADVTVHGASTLMALTAGASGNAGDFKATSLQASSTWTAGGNSGGFSWNYPLAVPPSLGGPVPQVALSYSSAAVDGRSEVTNNQPSWVGEGFDWWPGYVERRYKPCADDKGNGANNTTDTGDMCYGTDNATFSLNGKGGELIKDDATGVWRLKDDDNTTVQRLTDTVNGDNDNEYWKVTTANGTQYFFGRNRLPGYTGTAPANKTTNSTWTMPVAGNNTNEACHAATFTGSFCNQAWRWNLDYVVDVHGNTMSLFYGTETNLYGRNNTASDAQSYVRGGWLDHVDYGTDLRSGTDTENTSTAAPMRVTFNAQDRCLSACGTHDAAHWPDTPWDQSCAAAPCTDKLSPTFWTTKRLASVTTQVWNATAYKDVDVWTLTHNFPDPGDGTRAGLWLESIVHTGKATGPAVTGPAVVMPETNFDWVQMPNRVDSVTDGKFPMNWMRMSTIWTDTGGKISVDYTGPDCAAGSRMPASPQTNTLRCYPVLEQQANKSIKTEYFHKYLVSSVTAADWTGGGPDVVTSYEYVGDPAWRHTDDDGLTKDNLRTWSDYRGYAQVNTRVGDPGSGSQTLSEAMYFRGMHGDLNGAGGTRSVTLPAIDGNGDGDTADTADAPAVTDEDAYSGQPRQTATFDGVETAPLSRTFSEPWQSAATASRNMGETVAYARHTGEKTTWAGTKLAAGGWRVTRTDTTLDAYGMTTQSDDQGDIAVTGDEVCVKTTYNRNTGINLLNLVGRTETYALRCSANPAGAADVLSDSRTSFDGLAYGATPTKGDATTTEAANDWVAPGGSVWQVQSTSLFDDYGRTKDATDIRGNHTTTVFTPTTGGPVTAIATTSPLGTTTSTMEPSWGTQTAVVDPNGKRAEATFDALGRTKQVWAANRLKSAYPTTPSTAFTYIVRNSGGVNAVTTAALNAGTATDAHYTTTYALYDGQLRARQTQSGSMATGSAGTVFTETKYDDKGRAVSQSKHFDDAVQPGTTLYTIADWQPKSQTVSLYDRAGRVTASVFRSEGSELWRTTNIYGGDRVSVTPPTGGTATTTVTDGRGRTVELRQYHNAADVGSNTRSLYDLTQYHFDRKGRQDSVTDNAGNAWIYGFDLLGRLKSSHDPDKGDVTNTFNAYGDLDTSTDARGAMAYEYDTLGRKTGLYSGSVAPANKLASWAYDPAGFKGQLASSSRWLSNGEEYKVKVRSYTPTYQSTGEDYIVPPSLTGLATTYTVSRTFRADGSPATITYPAGGGLAGETVTYTYDANTGQPEQLQTNTGQGTYVTNTDFTEYGEMTFLEYKQTAGNFVQRSFTYDDVTRKLKDAVTIRQTAPQAVDATHYDYNKVGGVTAITSGTDKQCFVYDYAQRLTEAWTPTSGDCNQARSATALGGPAPYWQSWTFDSAGDRKTETVHTATATTTSTYNYPAAGGARPHAVSSVTTGSTTLNYQYDSTGNTTCRPAGSGANTCPGGTGSQALTWDAEGHLATATGGSGANSYIYTADGVRLVADDPAATTLYLPNMELKRTKGTGTVTATRYYIWSGQSVAMMTSGGAVTWLAADNQNTQNVAVAAGTQAVTIRRQNPYGAPRGAVTTWPNTKGFVSGDRDATGLTHLGAREYDPATGRFISVDPIFAPTDPASMNGYAYSNNSPVTLSDPSGQRPACDGDSGCMTGWTDGKNDAERAVNDPTAKCNGYCARQRSLRAAKLQKQMGPQYTKHPGGCASAGKGWADCRPTTTETNWEEDVAIGDVQVYTLEDIALTLPTSIDDRSGSVTITDATAVTTGWSKAIATKASVTMDLGDHAKLGAEVQYTYTWNYALTETQMLARQVSVQPGEHAYLAPEVTVKWEQVSRYKRDEQGNRVFVGSYMRMDVSLTATKVKFVKPGAKVPTVANTATAAQDLANSLQGHFDARFPYKP